MARRRKVQDRRVPFIVVARTELGHYPHPVEVALHPDGRGSRLSFSIGPHPVNAGGQVPLSNVLDHEQSGFNPMFDTEVDAADLHWLLPYLVRLYAGDDVSDEIRAAFVARHGRAPETMWQEIYPSG